jgi:MFS family permease
MFSRLAEVPSNYLLKKMPPSTWIAILMFSWGTITIGIAGVHSFAAVAVTRFLLGLFEAGMSLSAESGFDLTVSDVGLFPGIIYHMSKS